MWTCKKLSVTGPDIVKLGTAWKAAAIQSILFGCETLITSKQTISKLERIQDKFTKMLLGIRKTTPNICAQTETGLRFVKHNLYLKQISYFYRVLTMDKQRWAYYAMYEHIKYNSTYYKYINGIRQEMQVDGFTTKKDLEKQLNLKFLTQLNNQTEQL